MNFSNNLGIGLLVAMCLAPAQAQAPATNTTEVESIQVHFPVLNSPCPNSPCLVAVSTDGQLHQVVLPSTVTLSAQPGGSFLLSLAASGSTLVRNEVPVAGTAAGTWTLLRAPTSAGATCWENGVHQSPGLDYTLAGNIITSASWAEGDVLACDYQ